MSHSILIIKEMMLSRAVKDHPSNLHRWNWSYMPRLVEQKRRTRCAEIFVFDIGHHLLTAAYTLCVIP